MGKSGKEWEARNWLRTTENDWERLGKTGRRANETARPQDHETTGPRDHETTRLRDYETPKNTGVLRRSQAFSVVLSSARLCEAAWRQSGAAVALIKRLGWMDSTLTYIPFSPMIEASLMRRYHDKCLA